MYTIAEQITHKLDRLFPDEGKTGLIPFSTDAGVLDDVIQKLEDYWLVLPERLRDRVREIERNFHQRHLPLVLYMPEGSD